MPEASAHNSLWKTSDAIFGVAVALGPVLHIIPSMHIAFPLPPEVRAGMGAMLVASAVAVIALAKLALKTAGQPAAPGKPTTQIVDAGVYGYSRNPMYLGLVFLLSGLGLSLNVVWFVLLAVPMWFAFTCLLVLPEERYLLRCFGEPYVAYMARVRRWL